MFESDLNFDIAPVTIQVNIFGVSYVLREASGDATCKYHNFMSENTELKDGQPYRYHNFADREPLLVSLCLYDATNITPVQLEVVRSWPSRVVEKLFEKVKEISGMNAEEETKETLLKRLDEINKKLAALEKGADPLAQSSTGTAVGSGSQTVKA
jgi:hypothetical protein